MANDLTIRIGAELTEIKGALAGLQRDLGNLGKTASNAGAGGSLGNIEKQLGGAASAAKALFAIVGATLSVAAFTKLSDEARNLEARLRLVVDASEDFAAVQNGISALANKTGQSIAETTNLYVRLGQAVKGTGTNSAALLQVTEVVNNAVALSGASAEAANAALVQLGQGLASGTLRGEELNSILEQTPVVADAIAAGLGKTRGELRKLGEEGKLTTEAVLQALLSQREAIGEQAKTLPVTFSKAFTQIGNAALTLVGTFEKATGAGEGLAGIISRTALALQSPEVQGAVTEFAAAWRIGLSELASDVVESLGLATIASSEWAKSTGKAIDAIIEYYKFLPINLRAFLRIVVLETSAVFDSLLARARFLKDALKAVFTEDTVAAATARLNAELAAIEAARIRAVIQAGDDRDAAIAAAKQAREEVERARAAANADPAKLGKFKKPEDDKEAARKLKEETENRLKLLQDANKREQALAERDLERGLLTFTEYQKEKLRLIVEGIDAEIEQQKRLLGDDKTKADAQTQIELLNRRKIDAAREAEDAITAAEIAGVRQRAELRARELEATGDRAGAAKIRLEQQYEALLLELQRKGDAAGIEIAKRVFNQEQTNSELDAIKQQYQKFLDDQNRQIALISAQADAGLLAGVQAEAQVQDIRAKTIEQLKQYEQALREVYERTKDPAVLRALQDIQTESARAAAAQKTLFNTARDAGTSSLANFFTDVATGAKSLGEAARSAAQQFVQAIARMAAEVLAKRAILMSINALGGGGGGAAAGAAVLHTGGIVGSAGATRRVSPLTFVGAPRFHSGGMVGLNPGEVPAILQTGEEVLSRGDPRNARNGGGAGSGVRIINVVDPGLVESYMSSSAGERTIVNVLERNRGQIKQILG